MDGDAVGGSRSIDDCGSEVGGWFGQGRESREVKGVLSLATTHDGLTNLEVLEVFRSEIGEGFLHVAGIVWAELESDHGEDVSKDSVSDFLGHMSHRTQTLPRKNPRLGKEWPTKQKNRNDYRRRLCQKKLVPHTHSQSYKTHSSYRKRNFDFVTEFLVAG